MRLSARAQKQMFLWYCEVSWWQPQGLSCVPGSVMVTPPSSQVWTLANMYAHICIHHTHIHIQKLVKKSVDFSNENRMANGIVTCFILSKKGKIERKRKGPIWSLFGILIFYSLYNFLFSKSHQILFIKFYYGTTAVLSIGNLQQFPVNA